MLRKPILTSSRAFLASIVVVVTMGLAFLIANPTSTQYYLIWVAAAVLLILNSVPVLYEILYREDGPDPFSPILWVSTVFFFSIAVSTMGRLRRNDFSLEAQNVPSGTPPELFLPVVLFGIVGLCCLLFGYYSKYGVRIANAVPSFNSGWSSKRAWIGVVALMIIGVAGYIGLRGAIGDGPRTDLVDGSTKISFVAINLLNAATILAMADAFVSLRRGGSTRILSDPFGWLKERLYPYHVVVPKTILAVIVLGVSIQLLWTLGGRARAFGPLIAVAFLFHYLFWRMPYLLGTSFILIRRFFASWAAAVVAAVLTFDTQTIISTATNLGSGEASGHHTINNLTIVIAGVPDMLNFQYGKTFASAFFSVLPISPFPQTQFVFNRVFLPGAGRKFGVPISLLGELYLNFWIPGIIVGMLIVGLVMRFAYHWLITGVGRENIAGSVLFATWMNEFLLIGNFSNSAPALGLRILPMLIVLLFVTGIPPVIQQWTGSITTILSQSD